MSFETNSYKNKLLNLFGEEVTQKVPDLSSIDKSASSGQEAMNQDIQIEEINDGEGVVIPLSDVLSQTKNGIGGQNPGQEP